MSPEGEQPSSAQHNSGANCLHHQVAHHQQVSTSPTPASCTPCPTTTSGQQQTRQHSASLLFWPSSPSHQRLLFSQQATSYRTAMQGSSRTAGAGTGSAQTSRLLNFQLSFPVQERKHSAKPSRGCECSFNVIVASVAALLLLLLLLSASRTHEQRKQQQQPQGGPCSAVTTSPWKPMTGSARVANTEDVVWRRPAIVTFGDSLTEGGVVEGGWTARLAAAYRRKVRKVVWQMCALIV